MLTNVRTTLVLDDELLRQAKRLAAERNTTLSEVVNSALREAFDRTPSQVPAFDMITYGRADSKVQHEPGDFAESLEDDDRRSLRSSC